MRGHRWALAVGLLVLHHLLALALVASDLSPSAPFEAQAPWSLVPAWIVGALVAVPELRVLAPGRVVLLWAASAWTYMLALVVADDVAATIAYPEVAMTVSAGVTACVVRASRTGTGRTGGGASPTAVQAHDGGGRSAH